MLSLYAPQYARVRRGVRTARQAYAVFRKYRGHFRTAQRAYRQLRNSPMARNMYRLRASKSRRAKHTYRRGHRVSGARNHVPRLQTFYDGGGQPDVPSTIINSVTRKELWAAEIKFARVNQTARQLGELVGQKIKLRGLKICLSGHSLTTPDPGGTGPRNDLVVHFAIIQKKSFPDDNPIFTDFFSDPGGGQLGVRRSRDFPSATTDPSWDPKVNCDGINPRRFNVITHKKFKVYANNESRGGGMNLEHVNFDKYYIINKTFTYEDAESDAVDRPMYMCVWYENMLNPVPAAEVLFHFSLSSVSYFHSIV